MVATRRIACSSIRSSCVRRKKSSVHRIIASLDTNSALATALASWRNHLQQRRRQRLPLRHGIFVSRWVMVAVMMVTFMLAGRPARVRSFSFQRHVSRTMITTAMPSSSSLVEFSSTCSSFRGSGRFRLCRRPSPPRHSASRRFYRSSSSYICMMPEGPEVRTLVDQLQGGIGKRLVDIRFLSGRYVGQRPVGFLDFAHTMTPVQPAQMLNQNNNTTTTAPSGGSVDAIVDWNCKGKFIYILLDDGAKAISKENENGNEEKSDNDEDDDFQRSIWITLGMTGRFVNEATHLQDPSYGRWVLELLDDENHPAIHNTTTTPNATTSSSSSSATNLHKIYYHDKRNFGTVKFCLSKTELDRKLASLGQDVLEVARQTAALHHPPPYDDDDEDDDDEDDTEFASITIDDELNAQQRAADATQDFLRLLENQRNPRINVCKLLMDQKKIAGVGNYILSEALYRSHVDPFCGIDELSTSQRIQLFREIQAVCLESYRSQQATQQQKQQQQQQDSSSAPPRVTGSSSSSGYSYTSVRELQAFSFTLRVYGNQGRCPKGNPVIRDTQGPHGRTIWYTEEQLFVARHIREQREQEAQRRLPKQPPQAQAQAPRNDATTSGDRWTITRRNGKPVVGANDEDAVDFIEKEIVDERPSAMPSSWNLLDGLTDPGWKEALAEYTQSSPSFAQLQGFLEEEYSRYGRDQIYPPPHQIFSALNLCPLHTVKVVILGQDPYHGPNQSTGLAFSVSKQISKIPPSLRNIFKELQDDVGRSLVEEGSPLPEIRHGDLEGWARQGVLMLNTVLTVRRGQANSHQKKGWEDFTDEIVRIVKDRNHVDNASGKDSAIIHNDGLVFLLWGGPASRKAKSIVHGSNRHVVIQTSHPSPLGATKTSSPFLGSKCFTRANAALRELGQDPINWYDR